MRKLPWLRVEQYRLSCIGTIRESHYGDDFGAFIIQYNTGRLRIIASSGDADIPWEHVSVSLQNRCPNWPEMCYVKDLFWGEDETVMQLHVPKEDYINFHPFCLHLWKPIGKEILRPPNITVGPKSIGQEE